MPERLIGWFEQIADSVFLLFLGAIFGLGQHLMSAERACWQVAVGRAISFSGLTLAANSALVFMPDLGFSARIGLAALLASLGISGLERLFLRVLQGGVK